MDWGAELNEEGDEEEDDDDDADTVGQGLKLELSFADHLGVEEALAQFVPPPLDFLNDSVASASYSFELAFSFSFFAAPC